MNQVMLALVEVVLCSGIRGKLQMAIHLTTEGVPFLDILVSTVTLSEDHGITGVNVLLKYHPL